MESHCSGWGKHGEVIKWSLTAAAEVNMEQKASGVSLHQRGLTWSRKQTDSHCSGQDKHVVESKLSINSQIILMFSLRLSSVPIRIYVYSRCIGKFQVDQLLAEFLKIVSAEYLVYFKIKTFYSILLSLLNMGLVLNRYSEQLIVRTVWMINRLEMDW